MKNIVYIGGGGGVSSVVPGLRDVFNVTAILTTFDDGGSYGTFRRDYKSSLTGDIRRALASLSANALGEQSEFRFEDGEMQGHTLGNILLTSAFLKEGDPAKAMDKLHELYAVKGNVLGVSYDLAELQAQLKDRSIIRGEHTIDEPHAKSHIRIDRVWLDPEPAVATGVLEAIRSADMIILGPGDLYTSVIPALLVPQVAEAIKSSPAKRVYFCNRFTKYGQTNGFDAADHARIVEKYLGCRFHTVVISTTPIPEDALASHAEDKEDPVLANIEELRQQGYHIVEADLHEPGIVESSKADKVKRSRSGYKPQAVLRVIENLFSQSV